MKLQQKRKISAPLVAAHFNLKMGGVSGLFHGFFSL